MQTQDELLKTVMTLGEAVRVLRESKQMTLRELARQVDVSAPFLSDLEHNRRSTKFDRLPNLAKALGVDVDVLSKYRPSPELKAWISANPELSHLLDEYRQSGKDVEHLLQALRSVGSRRRSAR